MENTDTDISLLNCRGIEEETPYKKNIPSESIKISETSKKLIHFPGQHLLSLDDNNNAENRTQPKKIDLQILEHLKQLIQIKFQDNLEFQNELLISYFLAYKNNQITPSRTAKLLYLIDHHPKSVIIFFRKNKNIFFYIIEELFSKKANNIKNKIIDSQGNSYISNQIPATLVDIIWTSTGFLNINIIKKLKTHFFPIGKIASHHEKKILYILDELIENPSFANELLTIKRDSGESLEIDHAVRAHLSLPALTPITSLHLQKTALMALLSHPRQNLASSCFASFLPISLMTANPMHVLGNLKSLLINDCLEFKSDKNITTQIPYHLVIPSENMKSYLHINSRGEIFEQNINLGSLTQYPEWKAVCRGLNLDDPEEALQNTLKALGSLEKGKHYKIQKKDILMALCRTLKSSDSIQHLFSLAKFYYKSVSYSPLLACWENAIATLAETQANSTVKTVLTNGILSQILISFENILSESVLKNQQIASFIINTLSNRLHRTTRLAYDPDLQGIEGIEGGFVLEVRFKRKWLQIESSNDFLKICDHLLLNLHKEINLTPSFQEEKNELQLALETIRKNLDEEWVVNITDHLKNTLINNLGEDPSIHASRPWSILTGHDADEVLKLYFGILPPKIEFTPVNTKEALEKLLSISYEHTGKSKLTQLPFRIKGFHACTLLTRTLQEKQMEENLLKDCLKDEKEEISSSHATDLMVEELWKICEYWAKKSKVKFNFNKEEFTKDLSIHKLRNKFIKIFSTNLKKRNFNEFEEEIDKNIIQLLPDHLKKIWLSTVIPFADTNWHEGSQDIFFCFVYNPGTKKMDVWEMTEDKKILRKKNTELFLNRSWNIYFPFNS